MITPIDFSNIKTAEQLDEKAIEMASLMGEVFPPAPNFYGKKRNKLRELAAKYAGFKNGYQQFLEYIESKTINKPSETFDLPDELVVVFPLYDIEGFMIVCKPAEPDQYGMAGDNEMFPGDENVLHTIYEEGVVDQPNALKDIPLWQFIVEHYTAHHMEVHMASINEYGICKESTDDGGAEFVESLYLHLDEMFDVCPVDRGDDGTANAVIHLKRKS